MVAFEGNYVDIDMEKLISTDENTKNYLLGQYLNNTTLSSRQFISIVEKIAPLGLFSRFRGHFYLEPWLMVEDTNKTVDSPAAPDQRLRTCVKDKVSHRPRYDLE